MTGTARKERVSIGIPLESTRGEIKVASGHLRIVKKNLSNKDAKRMYYLSLHYIAKKTEIWYFFLTRPTATHFRGFKP